MTDLPQEKAEIINAVLQGESVSAVANAGCGKTYTIERAIDALLDSYTPESHRSVLALAFNTANAKGLNVHMVKAKRSALLKKEGFNRRNLGEVRMKSMTFHGAADSLIKGLGLKFNPLADNREVIDRNGRIPTFKGRDLQKAIDGYQRIKALLGAKVYDESLDIQDISNTLYRLGLEFDKVGLMDAANFFHSLLKANMKKKSWKSAADMIFLSADPSADTNAVPKYDLIILDEFQDCTPEYIRIALAYSHEGTQWFVSGDPKQTINGFQGSVGYTQSLEMLSEMGSIEFRHMRLRETYRNSVAIAQHVNTFFGNVFEVEGVSHRDGGLVAPVQKEDIVDILSGQCTQNPQDWAILAPTNAQALEFFGELVANGIRPVYTGFDGSQSANIVEGARNLLNTMGTLSLAEASKALKRQMEGKLFNSNRTRNQIRDSAPYMVTLLAKLLVDAYEGFEGIHNASDAAKESQKMEGYDKAVTIGTYHKSKGCTYGNGFVVGMEGLGETFEESAPYMAYVGMTRFKDAMYLEGIGVGTLYKDIADVEGGGRKN